MEPARPPSSCFGADLAEQAVIHTVVGDGDEEAEAAILRSLIVPVSAVKRMMGNAADAVESLGQFYPAKVLVEIVAHVSVMFLSEVLGVHQKQMGYSAELIDRRLKSVPNRLASLLELRV